VLHSLLPTILLVQLSSPQATLLALKQNNLLAVLHAPLVVLNGLPIILQILLLNGVIIIFQMSSARRLHLPHATVPQCGIHWWNDWKYDVKPWMRSRKFPEYYDLVHSGKTGARQAAHKMIKSSHCSYCFYLAGSKYVLQMLLKLPILAQCSSREL